MLASNKSQIQNLRVGSRGIVRRVRWFIRAAINTSETTEEKEIATGERPTVEPDGVYTSAGDF